MLCVGGTNSDTGNNCVAYLVSFLTLAAAGDLVLLCIRKTEVKENRSEREELIEG